MYHLCIGGIKFYLKLQFIFTLFNFLSELFCKLGLYNLLLRGKKTLWIPHLPSLFKEKNLSNLPIVCHTFPFQLSVGMHCRAIYPADGCYYEAKVRKVGKDYCTVEFLGYGDLERVDPMTLRESSGKKARKNQIKLARDENSIVSRASLFLYVI